ncbi:hypothetical protein JHK82_028094 [Glycine max]|nr:hypothetical protein JHK85_028757 [Glycine max]KAG5004080.1 hypothetical protein JHK86_028219 [Glycine max]KAG5127259.1 hypothetical protein JHK82_028094 [Glycine max]KAG5151874.1 hypothetical protein JHK84_028346 [Glycine max]
MPRVSQFAPLISVWTYCRRLHSAVCLLPLLSIELSCLTCRVWPSKVSMYTEAKLAFFIFLWYPKTKIWERLRGGFDEIGRWNSCPLGLHADGMCSFPVRVGVRVRVCVGVRVRVRSSSHSSSCSSLSHLVTLDLSSTMPLWVYVYSDPGAHLSVKFPSKELLEKYGWNDVVEVIEAMGEGDVFHLLNPDCDNVVSFINHS